MNTTGGYFIKEDIRAFENGFFGINNLETKYMDPQQRKLLEVVFECFESAGITLDDVSGANYGCYVGNFTTDHQIMQDKDAEYYHRYSATGMGTTILANRISHVFNLKGPSFVLDTACSSSLYCLHTACAALDAMECDAAVVAGVNLIQSPEQHLRIMKAGVLSKTSTCHTFDSSADGYGRADGVGALLLKRLSDAIRDGDPVRSVIRGTAINSNGKTFGITLPDAAGQEAVIRKAYSKAGLGFGDTTYIEAHGTGTAVGDPIEMEAISRVFGRPAASPLMVGSVKTNVGHSEAASAISSIIKVTLAMEKGEIPPTIGVTNLNPKLGLDERNIRIVTDNTSWPPTSIRRAGINSFGYGGANAHAILEAAEHHVPSGYGSSSGALALAKPTFLLPFSATSKPALEARVTDLIPNGISPIDLAYTLGVRRSRLPIRGYLLAGSETLHDDLSLSNLQTGIEGKDYSKLPIAFVFTGQGAQWSGMGHELMEQFSSYRDTIRELDATLKELPHAPKWTLEDTIRGRGQTGEIDHASRSQPVCTAVQIALVQLLARCGVQPEAVVGHSSGEIAAAYTAGLITARDAIVIAFYRGLAVTENVEGDIERGAMLAAGMSRNGAEGKIKEMRLDQNIRVACVNSPQSVTLSGDADQINILYDDLRAQQIFVKRLNTGGKAYHSHHMDRLGDRYEKYLESAKMTLLPHPHGRLQAPIKWFSSVTLQEVVATPDPSYWRANLQRTVFFSDAVRAMITDSSYHLIEVGPHSALELPIKQIWEDLSISVSNRHYGSVLSRAKNSIETLLNMIGTLYLHGHDIPFSSVNCVDTPQKGLTDAMAKGKFLPDLPPYRWSYGPELWNECRLSREFRNRRYPRHDLLGSQVPAGDGVTIAWRNILKVNDVPWLEGHRLASRIVFPGAGYIAMAIEAVCQANYVDATACQGLTLRHVNFLKALTLDDATNDSGVELFTTIRPLQISATKNSDTWWQFSVSSFSADGDNTENANGLIAIEKDGMPIERALRVSDGIMEPNAARIWYTRFQEEGLNFGESFQSLEQIETHRGKGLMHSVSETLYLQGGGEGLTQQSFYPVHPITLDALLQTGIIASSSGSTNALKAKVPVKIERICIRTPKIAEKCHINAVSRPVGTGTIRVNAELHGTDGNVLIKFGNVRAVPYQGQAQSGGMGERHPMLRVVWKPDVTQYKEDDAGAFSSYIDRPSVNDCPRNDLRIITRLGNTLDLVVHKQPELHILLLELDNVSSALTEHLLDVLRFNTAFKRCRSYTIARCASAGKILVQDLSISENSGELQGKQMARDATFDIIIIPDIPPLDVDVAAEQLKALLATDGKVIGLASPPFAAAMCRAGFSVVKSNGSSDKEPVLLARLIGKKSNDSQKSADVILVGPRDGSHALHDSLETQMAAYFGRSVRRISLQEATTATIPLKSIVISTIELENPILAVMSSEEMRLIKILTDNAGSLFWITGGGMLTGARPDFALVNGLSRCLMLEQPSLRFFTVDVDDISTNLNHTTQNILSVVKQGLEDTIRDFEFIQHSGVLHISRFVPEELNNLTFRKHQGYESVILPLEQAKPAKLAIGKVGQLDTIHFASQEPDDEPLAIGFVEVDVKAVGLNAKVMQDAAHGTFITDLS